MSGREDFERRLGASVRDFVETAPADIDAARLAHSLATSEPLLRRLVPRPRRALPLPRLGLAWVQVAAVLVLVLGTGLFAAGAFRNVPAAPGSPTPSHVPETSPVVVSPATTTPPPSVAPPSQSPSASLRSEDVVFTSLMILWTSGPNTGTFSTTGQASTSGLICPHGTVTDLAVVTDYGGITDFTVPKQFTCDDGSGTFTMELHVHVVTPGTESLQWQILRGTGAYTRLQGAGTGTTVSAGPNQVTNTLTGSLFD
jgi:hypothetical protein